MTFKDDYGPNVAVIGASKDKTKFSNKAVRAFKSLGYNVFPVNINEKEIEGLTCYKTILEIGARIDFVSLYLPPTITMVHNIPYQIKTKGVKAIILNPGSESEELMDKLKELRLQYHAVCSILKLGKDPNKL
jgi:uncharacterized protein